ncbi:MAG: putative protein YqeY [Candidatus Omnitrophica bacterium]|nr:putative protein YqeY [Candidatus Omnitrophota bacterium]
MSLTAKIDQDMKEAMLARQTTRVEALRFLKSAVKYAAIEKKTGPMSDDDVRQVIQKQIKQRRESIDQFAKNGRRDLADKESAELAVLESYLPQQMNDEELAAMVRAVVQECGLATKKDFGRGMKALQDKAQGRAEPKRLSEALGQLLQ